MNFKEQLKADVAVFLNPDEFGEPITIDGVETIGIWDDATKLLTGDSLNGIDDANTFGLLANVRTLYVSGISMPLVGQNVVVDGEYFEVMPGSQDNMGVLTLMLQHIYS